MAYTTARPVVSVQTFDSHMSTDKDALPLPSVMMALIRSKIITHVHSLSPRTAASPTPATRPPPSHGASAASWHESEGFRQRDPPRRPGSVEGREKGKIQVFSTTNLSLRFFPKCIHELLFAGLRENYFRDYPAASTIPPALAPAFVVSAQLLNHPIFVKLLNKLAQEYGFDQKGVLHIPCRARRDDVLESSNISPKGEGNLNSKLRRRFHISVRFRSLLKSFPIEIALALRTDVTRLQNIVSSSSARYVKHAFLVVAVLLGRFVEELDEDGVVEELCADDE
ncbi:hypothetical protein RHMOL_Rhmol05G0021200 [Rhododendron molle]|uniref:Uncharacterized protein n=1 Tax=Rhododendron molle TaxID=49168 RepID=A0ACC0NKV6_RHOML|nr:hypothetical protein RHMOL_Rhmol05G0021200 [Rhododendron molle]